MSLIAIVVSFFSVLATIVMYILGIRRNKKQDTLDAFNALQAQVFDKLNLYTYKEIDSVCAAVRGDKLDDESSRKYYELLGYLARLEHFSLGVNTGIYDAKTAERAGTGYLVGLYRKLTPLIELQHERARKFTGKDKEYYAEFKKLAQKIKKLED